MIQLDKLCSDGTKVAQQLCNICFPVTHGSNKWSQKHNNAEQTLASVKNRHDGDSESYKTAAHEGLVAYHTIKIL